MHHRAGRRALVAAAAARGPARTRGQRLDGAGRALLLPCPPHAAQAVAGHDLGLGGELRPGGQRGVVVGGRVVYGRRKIGFNAPKLDLVGI